MVILSASSRERRRRKRRAERNSAFFYGVVGTELELDSGKKKQCQSNEEQDAAGRGELVDHGPEELLDNGIGALPVRELVDFVPVDVFAVEAVAGAGVGGELRPEVVDAAAFADALPEVAEPGKWRWSRFGSVGSLRGGRGHGKSIGERGFRKHCELSEFTVGGS